MSGDRRAFEEGRVEIGAQPRGSPRSRCRDFVVMVATEPLLRELDAQLGRKDLAPAARHRFELSGRRRRGESRHGRGSGRRADSVHFGPALDRRDAGTVPGLPPAAEQA